MPLVSAALFWRCYSPAPRFIQVACAAVRLTLTLTLAAWPRPPGHRQTYSYPHPRSTAPAPRAPSDYSAVEREAWARARELMDEATVIKAQRASAQDVAPLMALWAPESEVSAHACRNGDPPPSQFSGLLPCPRLSANLRASRLGG